MSNTSELDAVVDDVVKLQHEMEALPSSSRLSSTDAEAVYAMAYTALAQGQYEAAFRYFSLLTFYKPTNVTYLSGLARVYKIQEKYDAAINVYSFLATIDATNPAHTLAIAECMLLQRAFDEARHTLGMVVRYCREKSGFDKLLARAEALTALLNTGAVPA